MKKNYFCPYHKTCRDACYGEPPCDMALAFDKLQLKMEWWKAKAKKYEETMEEKLVPRFYGDYVFSPLQNAFNGKTSWWLSKKGCAVSLYCFSGETGKEADYQLADGGAQVYIKMFEEGLK